MKICKQCGAENKDGSNYCHDCGAKLNNSVSSSKSSPFESFKTKTKKAVKITIVAVVLLMLIAVVAHVFFGMPLDAYTEAEDTHKPSQFNIFDLNGDGEISYYEASSLTPEIPQSDLLNMFGDADKNDNGILIGREFDNFLYKMEKYYKNLKKQEEGTEEKSSQEKTETSSFSIPKTEYIDACPECGCDVIVEYQDYDGNTIYQCSACEYSSYDYYDFIIEVES